MLSHYQQTLAQLERQLPEYTGHCDADLAARATTHCQRALEDIFSYWQQQRFRDSEEEIAFFRQTYPTAMAHWIFWSQVRIFEEMHPVGTADMSIPFYSGLLKSLAPLVSRWQGAAARLEHIDEDKYGNYFTTPAGREVAPYTNTSTALILPVNEHSQTLASCWAYQRLADYLVAQIDRLSAPPRVARGQHQLRWVLSKAALTELVYALHEYGAFDGRPEIARVSSALSEWFGVDLGNIYKAYEGIRIRKKDRTPFVSGLLDALQRRLDRDDLHAL